MLSEQNCDSICAHLQRLVTQSGENGAPLFNVFDSRMRSQPVIEAAELQQRMSRQVSAPGWQRSWTAVNGTDSSQVIAHVFMIGGAFRSEMHRAEITVGVEANWRRQGMGRNLVEAALQWALRSTSLSWIDLQMIAANEPALKLYKRFGFRETSAITDRYRIDGFEVAALSMSLNLEKMRR